MSTVLHLGLSQDHHSLDKSIIDIEIESENHSVNGQVL